MADGWGCVTHGACGERTAALLGEGREKIAAHSSREKKRAKQTSFRTKGPISPPLSFAGNIILLITQHAGCDAKSNANSCGEN